MDRDDHRIRTLIVAADAKSQAGLLGAVKAFPEIEVVGATIDAQAALKEVRQRRPTIVLTDLAVSPMSGIELTREIRLDYPDVSVIVIAEQSGLGSFKEAMHVGASDFIVAPFRNHELLLSLRRTSDFSRERAARGGTSARRISEIVDGRLVAVCSGKGGVGKTTVSAGLAGIAASQFPGSVYLLDLDLQFGDVDLFLNLPTDRNLRSLAPVLQELDREAVSSVTQTTPFGLRVVLPPTQPDDADKFKSEDMSALLLFFKRTCALTIVDTGGRLDRVLLAAAHDADLLLLVTTPEVPALRNTAKLQDFFERLGIARERMEVVMNNTTRERFADAELVGKTLGRQVLRDLPFDYAAVARAANEGVFFSPGRSTLSASLSGLLADVIERLDTPGLKLSADVPGAKRSRNGRRRLIGGISSRVAVPSASAEA